MDRTILHCDLNNFYASVELLDHPELRRQPVAVCGDPESRHGIILAKNEVAKRYQVRTAETIWQARRKCPDLVLLPAHHEKYRVYSKAVNAIYERCTDLVEPFSIDESWLDVTGSLHLFGCGGEALADQLRGTIRRELGLTISVGVSFNKIFAKMGSDYRKPDATTVITRENFTQLLWPLPVGDMLFVGRAARARLERCGIRTIGDLARAERGTLVRLLGKQGGQLSDYARGLDESRVVPARELPPPKSIGNSMTFRRDLQGLEEVRAGLEQLSDSVAGRLRRHGLKCATVQVSIRDPGFHTITRRMGLSAPTYLTREIAAASLTLVERSWDLRAPIRMLAVTGLDLLPEEEAVEQLDLFAPAASPKREKLERLEKTVDAIRGRYGKESITLGSLTNGPEKGGKE